MNTSPEQKPSAPVKKSLRFWLSVSLLTLVGLLFSAFLLVSYLLSSPEVLAKIQQAVDTQAGVKVDFKSIELSYLPSPAIALQQVTITVPGRGQGTADEVLVAPAFLPLFTGELRLARLQLERPEVHVDLPDHATGKAAEKSTPPADFQESLTSLITQLDKITPDLDLVIHDGQVSVKSDRQEILSADNLNLKLTLAVDSPDSVVATLNGTSSLLSLKHNGKQETVKDAELDGRVALEDGAVSVKLERMAMSEPGLELSGELSLSQQEPGVTLNLSGKDINVDQTRRLATALAGDIEPVQDIFKYLRGGTIPKITVASQSKSLAELGDLKNLHIEGHLQEGAVSIPEIPLDLTEVVGDVLIADGVLVGSGMSTRLAGSTGHDGSMKIGLGEDNDLFHLDLMLNADLEQSELILKRVVEDPAFIEEMGKITKFEGTGVGKLVLGESLSNIEARVEVTELHLAAEYQPLPFPVNVSSGQLVFAEGQVTLKGWNGSIGSSKFADLDCQLSLPGAGKEESGGHGQLELSLSGTLEEPFVSWLEETLAVPEDYSVRTPFTLSSFSLTWDLDAVAKTKGVLAIENGPVLTFDVDSQPDQLNIHKLNIKDSRSNADMGLVHDQAAIGLNFSGSLHHESLEALFADKTFAKGQLDGDFSVNTSKTTTNGPSAKGHLKGSNLLFPLPSGDNVEIDEVVLDADGSLLKAKLTRLLWKGFNWDPVEATIDFSQNGARVTISEAKLCGVASPGTLTLAGDDLSLDLSLAGKGLDVASSYTCLTEGRVKMTGSLDVVGQISAQGQAADLLQELKGPFELSFENGVIDEDKLLSRLLEVLNITEIVKGRLPDLSSAGFSYKSITMQCEFKNGKMLFNKLSMDGETLNLLGYGEVDLVGETIDIELLASPFETIDSVIKHIPGINYLLAGSLVAIPVSIKGDLSAPKVQVLSLSSISSSLLNLGERTLKAPLKLIETITGQGKKKDE
jgi:hypothetical protein